ncbi:major capsid protein [uncultured Mediterranean phage uvDeep-CGR2-AD7-C12]|nr:major capsid protein [uncultured Mediterranean phage uvDeep-CGR2-AD7-C12]
MAAGNSNFDEILSTTLKNYVPKLTDNIFSARPLFYALTNGQTIRRISGGAKIVVPLIYGTNSTAGSYSGTDTISTTAQTGISAAEYDWKQYAATVTINGIEEAKNNGEAQIIDLLEGKIFQTQETIIENMNTMFFSDGTGNSSKDMNGLNNLVGTGLTVGGIDATDSDNSWWRSTLRNGPADAGAGVLTVAAMATVYNSVSVGNDQPTIIITDQDEYEAYEALLDGQIRYTDTDMADGGFQNLLFKGAPITFDSDTNLDGKVFFLNTKYIQLVAHSDVWFKPTPFVRPTNQDAVFSQLLCYGELTTSNRARQGMIYALSD